MRGILSPLAPGGEGLGVRGILSPLAPGGEGLGVRGKAFTILSLVAQSQSLPPHPNPSPPGARGEKLDTLSINIDAVPQLCGDHRRHAHFQAGATDATSGP